MIHHYLRNDTSGEHWAVGISSHHNMVLLQVQECSTQSRIQMTLEQAEACAAKLLAAVKEIREKL